MIVSESAARAIWPNEDPVGKIWKLRGSGTHGGGSRQGQRRESAGRGEFGRSCMCQSRAADQERSALILHTRGDPAALVHLFRRWRRTVNETVVGGTDADGTRPDSSTAQRRMVTLIGSIGVVAMALAAAGMFALVAFAVAQRRRELGIRMAIGASGRHILGMLLRQNARPTAAGAVAGAILAVILSRLVRSMVVMPNRDAVDVIGFAAGLVCFVLVAALATLSPAMRALRIDPSTTLREE